MLTFDSTQSSSHSNSLKVSQEVSILGYFMQLLSVIAIYGLFLLFSVFGPLSYGVVVFFVQLLLISFVTMLGIFSASSFFQVAIIRNMRLINVLARICTILQFFHSFLENYSDKKIIIASFCFAFSSNVFTLLGFLKVGQKTTI